MDLDVLEAQVIALRAAVDAMYAAIQAAKGIVAMQDDGPAECPHGETENIGTFGSPEIVCKACGATVGG